MMQKDNRYIAFVCTGNTCRSPMAEGIFNKLAKESGISVQAESFGIAAMQGAKVSEYSVEVCKDIDVDISNFTSTAIDEVKLEKYEKFYCMSQSHARILTECLLIPYNKIEILDISDPYCGNIDVYRMCCQQISKAVKEIIKDYEN